MIILQFPQQIINYDYQQIEGTHGLCVRIIIGDKSLISSGCYDPTSLRWGNIGVFNKIFYNDG